MLLTWAEDWGNKAVTRGMVVPDCCEAAQQSLAVYLTYPYGTITDISVAYRQAIADGVSNDVTAENGWKSDAERYVESLPEEERVTVFEATTPRWVTSPCEWKWYSRIHGPEKSMDYMEMEVTYCPHCGTKLPEVQRRTSELPNTVYTPSGDGDYCGTCNQRSMNCGCMGPTCAWETVKP